MSIGPLKNAETVKMALGVTAPIVAAWFGLESYKGHKDEWVRRHNKRETRLSMEELRYNWAKYDGQPWMTKTAKRLKHVMLHGPMGLKDMWANFKISADGFINDVILKNAVPIVLGTIGLYQGLGKHTTGKYAGKFRVHTPLRYINDEIIQKVRTALPPIKWGGWSKSLLDGATKATRSTIELAFRNKGISALVGGLTAFGLLRFKRVYTNEEGRDFMQDSLRRDFWQTH